MNVPGFLLPFIILGLLMHVYIVSMNMSVIGDVTHPFVCLSMGTHGYVWGSGWGSVQAQAQGSPGPHWGGGCPGPHLGGVQAHTKGVSRPRPIWGVSQHALRQTPPPSRRLLPRAVRILLECILVRGVLGFPLRLWFLTFGHAVECFGRKQKEIGS